MCPHVQDMHDLLFEVDPINQAMLNADAAGVEAAQITD